MKLLVFGDLQATDGEERSWTRPGTSLQQLRVELFFQRLLEIYRAHRCDGLVDLGDTTDDRSAIPVPTIEAIGTGLSRFPASDHHYKLTGNHEQFLKNARLNNRHLFSHMFHVVEENEIIDIDGWKAAFCSYPADFKALCTWLQQFDAMDDAALLFGHFTVAGCQLNGSTAVSGVPPALLKPFFASLLGHVHKPQALTQRAHYVGSPFQQNWGESGEAKRVCVVDTRATKIEDMLTFIPLEGFPVYKKVAFDEFRKLKEIGEDRIRVVLGNHEETEAYFQHPLFHRSEPVYSYEVEANGPEASQIESLDWSPATAMRRYTELNKPSDAGLELDTDELLEIGDLIVNNRL